MEEFILSSRTISSDEQSEAQPEFDLGFIIDNRLF